MSDRVAESSVNDEPLHRSTHAPYSSHHPVPNVQRYEQHQEERKRLERADGDDEQGQEGDHRDFMDHIKERLHLKHDENGDGSHAPYQNHNRNLVRPPPLDEREDEGSKDQLTENGTQDGTTQVSMESDLRRKRKAMKKREPQGTRVVTDPVTHLPVLIHDLTGKELQNVPQNLNAVSLEARNATGPSGATKDEKQFDVDADETEAGYTSMQRLFPPPSFQGVKQEISRIYTTAFAIESGAVVLVSVFAAFVGSSVTEIRDSSEWPYQGTKHLFLLAIILAVSGTIFLGLKGWIQKRIDKVWDDEVWDAARKEEASQAKAAIPESTQWLNRLLASIWPLVNPDLFTSLADKLEDVMQASLPKFVRMVAVEDIGQGSEAIRILGVKWLPTGAASKSVSIDGRIKNDSDRKQSDRVAPGQGQIDQDEKPGAYNNDGEQSSGGMGQKLHEEEDESIAEGLEKEEGEFVNVEIAFSYRATSQDKRLSQKAKHAHLYIVFYMPGSIPVPVWVSLQGIVGILRMRLQLTPDPPFVALATITLLGQPKAELQAIPLTKHFVNVMDLPFISGFVQSSIDAALAEYVAPKSLTLNLKEMLMGDDFKKDVVARGVIVARIKRAYDFKEADAGLGPIKDGSSDPYVTVGWAKFGKPLWSTRIIIKTMEPVWDETALILVSPTELNAGERLRIQLWDSDRLTADDDCGRLEVDLKTIMHDSRCKGRMWDRKDSLIAMQAGEKMPGSLEWSVGWFPKINITQAQLRHQKVLPGIDDLTQLRDKVAEESGRKVREARQSSVKEEIEQQSAQDLTAKEEEMIAASPPPEDYPTGIFSIQLHNITGLQLQLLGKDRNDTNNDGTEGTEVSDDLPSSFATVIINGQKVFKTRTKPKNTKPFFNASVERVIRDWRNTEIMISVQDSRTNEDDALIGLVYLNLRKVLRHRCQVCETYPLVGGIGFGRFRISIVFRAISLQAPRELLGWEYGTLRIGKVSTDDLPKDLCDYRIKLKGSINRVKVHSQDDGTWKPKHGSHAHLGIRNRYSTCLAIQFRKNSLGPDKTPAFGILWLKDIPDNEERTIKVPIWQGDSNLEKAMTHCLEKMGEQIGSLNLELKFIPGLSRYHRHLARKNKNLRDVIEVLETARDSQEVMYDNDDDSDSSDDSSAAGSEGDDDDGDDDGDDDDDAHGLRHDADGSLVQQAQDYRKHRKTLHRQHKGLMQWKAPRTAKWMKSKLEGGKDKMAGVFNHHGRDPAIETEV